MKPVVFVEGGGGPTDVQLPSAPAGIQDLIPAGPVGTQMQLQDAFYILFEKAIPDLRVRFEIRPSEGWKQTVKRFANHKQKFANDISCLLVDYKDINGKNKLEKCAEMQKEIDAKHVALNLPDQPYQVVNELDKLFFMVQTMEAWILSQPAILDEVLIDTVKDSQRVANRISKHKKMGFSIIPNPSHELRVLVGYYKEQRKGEWKRVKLGKIKIITKLLPVLNIDQLISDFNDVRDFVMILRSHQLYIDLGQ